MIADDAKCHMAEVWKVRERTRISPPAWDAASLLLGHPCCINPLEMGDYENPGRGYYKEANSMNEIEKRVSRAGDDTRY